MILKVEEHSINRFNVAIEWIAGKWERQIAHKQTRHLLIILPLITTKFEDWNISETPCVFFFLKRFEGPMQCTRSTDD